MKMKKLLLMLLIAALTITSAIPTLSVSVNSGVSVKTRLYPMLEYEMVGKFSDGLASAKKGNKYGFINSWGQEVIPLQYSSVEKFSEGLAAVRKDGKWGFIDKDNNIVIKFEYEGVGNFSDGLARIKKDGKWGYIDKIGKIVIQPIYLLANDFKEGLAAVYNGSKFSVNLPKPIASSNPAEYDYSVVYKDNDGKWGFIDKTGKKVIPFEYDDISGYSAGYNSSVGFMEGLAALCKDMKWGYIDQSGETVIPFKYDEADHFSEGLACVLTRRKTNRGNTITEVINGAFLLKNNCDRYYINKTGKIIITVEEYEPVSAFSNGGFEHGGITAYPFSNGLAKIDVNAHTLSSLQGMYKFIDKSGNSVIEFGTTQYNIVSSFDTNGLATVRIGKGIFLYGCVDKTGKEVVPTIYRSIGSFNEGLAAVCMEGKWGILQIVDYGK